MKPKNLEKRKKKPHNTKNTLSGHMQTAVSIAVGERLRAVRNTYNMGRKTYRDGYVSQTAIARHIGVEYRVINGAEQGHTAPVMDTLEAIADFWNISIQELLEDITLPTIHQLLDSYYQADKKVASHEQV